MRRLVVTGLPCPSSAWEKLLGIHPDQRIVTLAEVFANTKSSDLRLMSRYIESVIAKEKPQSIVCHDLGVSLTMLALLRLGRRSALPDTKVSIFSGALRKVNVLKANHPIRVQWMRVGKAIQEVKDAGGEVDDAIVPYFGRIRAMYRLIIAFNLVETVAGIVELDRFLGVAPSAPLRMPMQIIASTNDPYIPIEAVRQLKEDFQIDNFTELPYGHFPYSGDCRKLRQLVEDFECGGRASAEETFPGLSTSQPQTEAAPQMNA